MKHHHTLKLLPLLFLSVAGCESDSSDSAFNPATNVDLVFSTFEIDQPMEETLLWDFYRGVEPAEGASPEANNLAVALRSQAALFIDATESDAEPTQYISVRNPLDLMHQVIGENAVDNFNAGRAEISLLIDEARAGEYNTTTNGVRIRFRDQAAITNGAPAVEHTWNYPILKWSYTPDAADNVIRVIQYIGQDDGDANTTPPSASYGSEFTSGSFQSVGYNPPVRAVATFVIDGERELGITREFENENTDFLIFDGTAIGNQNEPGGPDFTFADRTVDCVRVELDYAMQQLHLFQSHNEPPRMEIPSDSESDLPNPDYCANMENATDSYPTVLIGERA